MSRKTKKRFEQKEEQKMLRGLQVQWMFVVIGSLIAIFLSVAVNAGYDLLKTKMPVLQILLIFGISTILFVDILSFLFEKIEEVRASPENGYKDFIIKYISARFLSIKSIFKRR